MGLCPGSEEVCFIKLFQPLARKGCSLEELSLGLRDGVLFHVAGEHQGQGAVAGDVAGGAEAVLKGEDGEHEGGAVVQKAHDAHNKAQRGHHRAARYAGGAYGKDAQQDTEQDHSAQSGQVSVEDLGHGHHKEHLSEDRTAQVDVGKQGDAEIHHVLTQDGGLFGTAQGHRQRGGRGHGAHSGEVGGAIVPHHFPGVFT